MYSINNLTALVKRLAITLTLFACGSTLAETKLWLETSEGQYEAFHESSTDLRNTVSATQVSVELNNMGSSRVLFSPPDGEEFAVGQYLNTGPMSQGRTWPSLEIVVRSQMCSFHGHNFYIYEFDLVEGRVAVDFDYYCGSRRKGGIRINSEAAFPYPTTEAVPYVIGDTAEGREVTFTGTRSYSNVSNIVSYTWRQLSGKAAIIDSPNAETSTVTLPSDIALDGETLTFQLEVVAENGALNTTDFNLEVISKSAPMTFVEWETFEFSGPVRDNTQDMTIEYFRIDDNGLSVSVNSIRSSGGYNIELAAPESTSIQVGKYENATGPVNQASNQPIIYLGVVGAYCNDIVGNFTIHQLDGPDALRASAVQYCNGSQEQVARATISINGKHPSVPVANIDIPATAKAGDTITLSASASSDNDGTVVGYQWSSNSNLVQIVNATNERADLTIDESVAADTEISLTLLITDDLGYQDRTTATFTVTKSNSNNESESNGSSGGGVMVIGLLGLMLVRRQRRG